MNVWISERIGLICTLKTISKIKIFANTLSKYVPDIAGYDGLYSKLMDKA